MPPAPCGPWGRRGTGTALRQARKQRLGAVMARLFIRRSTRVGVKADEGHGVFPVVAPRHDLVDHVRGERDCLLDLLGAVLLPVLGDEEGLLPAHHDQEPVLVPKYARSPVYSHPSAEGLRRCLGILEVALHDVAAPDHDLRCLSDLRFALPSGFQQAAFDGREDAPRAPEEMALGTVRAYDGRRLRQAVPLVDGHAECCEKLLLLDVQQTPPRRCRTGSIRRTPSS